MRPGVRVDWPDHNALRRVQHWLAGAPALTTPSDVEHLRWELSCVADGDGIVVQGGDCAESFERNTPSYVQAQMSLLHELGDLLRPHAQRVLMGARAAGQYFKPRSGDVEPTPSGAGVLKYRGDGVNSSLAHPELRVPDPSRIVAAYENARLTTRYMSGEVTPADASDIFLSHEAMLLEYEAPLTRAVSARDRRRYCASTHLPWIGVRSNEPTGAHVAWASRIINPIAVKVGPGTTEETVVALARALDPQRIPGRLVFIHRLGAMRVGEQLPRHIKAVTDAGWRPVWLCDPMHGNSLNRRRDGLRTRVVETIIEEIRGFWRAHALMGTHPGGVHLELTADPVTECVDRLDEVERVLLRGSYLTLGDPRLNREQAFAVVDAVRNLIGHDIRGEAPMAVGAA
jgi:3-deoxy-D-arabino-heptulosonate 7-phosphate (DAHP) synthase class II